MSNFQVYIDESGNTGHNIFDENQPYFWIGGLLLPQGKSDLAEEKIRPLKLRFNLEELHGNELGLGTISEMSAQLMDIYEDLNAKFLFVRINKPHISTMKFIDALIDSEHNPAIPQFYYASRGTRLLLAQPIAALFSEDAQKVFWDIYVNHKVEEFKEFLLEFKEALLNYIPDPRLKELLISATDFAIKYPEIILDESNEKYESPNLVSFSLFLHGLKNILPSEVSKISSVIHDEQNEFAEYLKEMFDIMKNISIEQRLLGHPKVEIVDTFTSQIDFHPSNNSAGLQLIDIAMWLLKQELDKDKKIFGEAAQLLDFIKKNGFISHFSLESLTSEANSFGQQIMAQPYSEEALKMGAERVKELEKHRKSNLSQFKL